MSASFRTITFSFEAVRGEYLSRTQRATQRPAILSMLQMEIYGAVGTCTVVPGGAKFSNIK